MRTRGFSVVEIVVVLAVLSGLLILALAGFSNYQVNADDEKRKAKAENIARYLEDTYKTGSASPAVAAGSYPSTAEVANDANVLNLFNKNGFDIKNVKLAKTSSVIILKPATNGTVAQQQTSTVAPQPDENTIVYQPIQFSGSDLALCTNVSQVCRSFNIYYAKKSDNTIHKIESIHQ